MKQERKSARVLNWLNEAIALHNAGQLDQADAIYLKVLRENPRHADALHLRALVFTAKENFLQAARLADAAIAATPNVANFYNTAGNAWRCLGRLPEARERLQHALHLAPTLALAHHNLALVFDALNEVTEARKSNRKALELDPNYIEALIHALVISIRDRDRKQADLIAARLERLTPRRDLERALGQYRVYLADEFLAQGNPLAAAEHTAKALSASPDCAGAWIGAGTLDDLHDRGDEAELNFCIAANLAPNTEAARLCVAHHLNERQRLDEAESHYAAWLAKHPDNAPARFGLAGIALARGDFARGWEYYESRWELPEHGSARFIGAPEWDGRATQRLLLYAEQGLGDTIQMFRLVAKVFARGVDHVVVLVPQPLERLLKRASSDPRLSVASNLPPAPHFDFACSLMSLPRVLGANTEADLSMTSPYLRADQVRQADFREKLAAIRGKKLGLVWQGGKAGAVNPRRAIPEEAFLPLLKLAGWSIVSLQKGAEAKLAGYPLVDLAPHIDDFFDLAAAMLCMDAVVCVDTGPAHLAGALGIHCHTLVPWLHDWRWGIAGSETYWYPSMTLIRQMQGEPWERAIASLVEALEHRSSHQDSFVERETRPARIVEDNHYPFVSVRCRHGVFTLPLFDKYITRSLLIYGEYSPREAEMLCGYIRQGNTVIDVGANLGALSLPMAKAVGSGGHLIAFEPQKMVFGCLAKTLERNALDWAEARHQAVGKTSGQARIPLTDPGGACNFGGISLTRDGKDEPVAVVSLDDLELATCRLIKIDVEGMEMAVLQGARRTLGRCRPILYVECDRPGTRTPIVKFLEAFGYSFFKHEPPLFSPANHRGCASNIFPGIVSGNLLALPPGEIPPIDAAPV